MADHSLLKYVSLFALLVQNCLVIILTRVVKQRDAEVPFASSAAVMSSEILKLLICSLIVGKDTLMAIRDSGSVGSCVRNAVEDYGSSTLKCAVPALCYTIQNNLIYYALGHLEVVVFQLLYQTKLLLTAVLSVLILSKSLKAQQWASLIALFIGMVIVQLAGKKSSTADGAKGFDTGGVLAAFVGAGLSAFSGVYFEMILKGDMKVSLFARNVQLAIFTVPISMGTVYMNDYDAVAANGVLGGFSPLVWAVVLLQAFGGLVVAACMKYADNIMKNFASSGAIILGAAVSVIYFGFEMSAMFVVGVLFVLTSMLTYDPTFCDCSPPLGQEEELSSLKGSDTGQDRA